MKKIDPFKPFDCNHDDAVKAISEATAALRDSFASRGADSIKTEILSKDKLYIREQNVRIHSHDTLSKSRFEGDNFRKRYMSKCQGESAAEKIDRLERISREISDLILVDNESCPSSLLKIYRELIL